MRQETFKIPQQDALILDLDVGKDLDYVYVNNKGLVGTRDGNFTPEVRPKHPMVRFFTNNSILLVDGRTTANTNGWLYSRSGKLTNTYYFGDGIQDLEVVSGRIAVTYFDEGVFGRDGPNDEGLAIFDENGELLFGYNSRYGEIRISDCYCCCKHGTNRLLLFPYVEFNLIEFNVDTFEETYSMVPNELNGSSAITSTKNSIVFYSPYHSRYALLEWLCHTNSITLKGHHSGGLRGLKNGQFLSVGEQGFTIVNISEYG